MEEQVNKKTVGIMISTTEKAGRALFQGARGLLASMRYQNTYSKGKENAVKFPFKTNVKDLMKEGGDVQILDIKKEGLKDFEKYARKYGVRYAVDKDKKTIPPTYYIFFRGKDGEAINKALSHFVKDQMEKEEKKDGVKVALEKGLGHVKKQPKKTKNKQQIR